MDRIEFKEFDCTDKIPSEIKEKMGNLKGDEANQFIKSVENHVRGFEETTKSDVKDYIAVLKKNLEKQNFADGTFQSLKKAFKNCKIKWKTKNNQSLN
ncbi:ATP/GTP-binding protein [Helicobacter acinonychis]|uniref:Uncharacterized protein n=1 Tax=Helicobacter acinonychis (strain Sheeba) TaxID=382638 RepID=Q17X21_HELAH|nr:conserved hypothetical protein fragment 3 [Helicobacter acinonychis str. Sheeba]STP04358.1 ATP/GTP-binding protein [Helicobacter acinonychis]